MSEQEQIKAIAELDGWYDCQKSGSGQWVGVKNKTWGAIPGYTTSWDAIVPVIEKQPSHTKSEIYGWLVKWWSQLGWSELSTPEQFCEAILRSTRKWKE
jgi:hypothetical protein